MREGTSFQPPMPANRLPAIEALVSTLYVYLGYVVVTLALGVLDLPLEEFWITSAGLLGIAYLGRVWRQQSGPDISLVKVAILLVGGILCLDLLVAWTS